MKKNRVSKAPAETAEVIAGLERLYPYYQSIEQVEDQKAELLADRAKTLGHTYYTPKGLIIHLVLGAIIYGIVWFWYSKASNVVTGYIVEFGFPNFVGLFAIWMAMIALFRKAGHAKRRQLIDKQVAKYDEYIIAIKRQITDDFIPVNCRTTEAITFMKDKLESGAAVSFKEAQQQYYEIQKDERQQKAEQ